MGKTSEQTLYQRRYTDGKQVYRKTQHHLSLKKCKLKQQRGTITHLKKMVEIKKTDSLNYW